MTKIEVIANAICKENGINYQGLKSSTKDAIGKFGIAILREAFKELYIQHPETQQDKLINFKILKILNEFHEKH